MRKMKDSGIEWVDTIPENWEKQRLKDIVSYNDETLSERTEDEFEFDYIDIGSVEYGRGITNFQRMKFCDSPSRARRVVHCDDVIISTVRTYLKAVARIKLRDVEQIVSTGFIVLRVNPERLHPSFLYFSALSSSFVSMIEAKSVGISYPAINSSEIVQISIAVPPLVEQCSIAIFLDKQCTHIDSIIEKTKVSIEEYKKLKQAIITHAVTKGVRGDRLMKDSGVEWIGEIPEEWEAMKYKYIASVKANLVHPVDYAEYPQIAPDNIEKGSSKLLEYKTVGEIGVESDNHLFYKGQIIYSKVRPILNKVIIAPFDGLCSADMYPIETNINTQFLVYMMLSTVFLSQVKIVTENRVKMPKINQEELAQIFVCVPTPEEQQEIVDYLNHKCSEMEKLISCKEQLLADLESYKKSMIYEYVTGKKEVPSA